MDKLTANCRAIELKDKGLAGRLVSYGKETVRLEEARSGDFTFKYADRYFHSLYDPWREAELQADEILSKRPDWVILFGLGCGYLLRTLIKRKKERIVVYEPCPEILNSAVRNIDLSGALGLENVHLCDDLNSLVNIIRNHTDGLDDLLGYQSTPYKQAFPKELIDFTNKVQNAHITNKVGICTDIDSRLSWIDNYFCNLRNFSKYPPIDILRGRFKDVPMVIAGAGPSLRKNAHLLKEIKGKALIVAAVTAYKPLVKSGVVPDFVIAAEKVDLAEYLTFGEEDRSTRLLLAEISHPNMFERDFKGKFIFFNPYVALSSEQARLWGSSYMPSTGGSVTTTALDIGLMLGCNPVVFIGQDLCYGDGETHAPGGVYVSQDIKIDKERGEVLVEDDIINRQERIKSSYKLLWLKGLNGQPVPSKFDWVTFHQWFENYMAFLKNSGCPAKVINATEGGAFIEGMEHTALKDVIAGFIRGDIHADEIINDAVENRPPVDFKAVRGSFKKMVESIGRIHKLAAAITKEAKEAEKCFEGKGLHAGLQGNISRIRRSEEKLFMAAESAAFIWESLAPYTYELKEYHKGYQRDGEAASGEWFKKDLEAVSASYKKIADMCGKFMPVLNNALEAVKDQERAAGRHGAAPDGGPDKSACSEIA